MARFITTIRNHTEALAFLGKRDSRRIAHNTYVLRWTAGIVGVVYHRTIIVRYLPDGSAILNTGGWHTSTTKQRLNALLPEPLSLFQHRHEWFLCNRDTGEQRAYHDGIRVRPEPSGVFVVPNID